MAQKLTAAAEKPSKAVPQILLKADHLTLTLTADKEGKIRLNCGSWDSPVVILRGQMLEARNKDGQVVLMRREGK